MNTSATPPFAAEAARCRSAQVAWAVTPIRARLRVVANLRRLLVGRRAAFQEAVAADVGKRPDEVIAHDILPTAEAFRFLERDANSVLAPKRVPTRTRPLFLFGQRDTVHRRPHGVVGIIGTWNYPVFLNGVQMAQALAAGNGVLWKPSEVAPRTAAELGRLFADAGFPADLVHVLPATREGGPQLLEADIDHLVFTGSAGVGRVIAKRLGERLVSSTLELSGCDAMFVLDDADVELAAKGAWFGATVNRGQTCLATRRVMVARPHYEAFLDRLRPLAEGAKPVKLAMRSQAEQASQFVGQAVESGARFLTPPSRAGDGEFAPTVLTDATPEMAVCRDAPFAPVMAVMPFDTLDDAVRLDERCPYALGASIFTADAAKAESLAARLRPGAVTVNDVIAPTAHPGTPFGGRGASGWGVTQGPDGLLGMTVPQVVSRRGGTFRPHFNADDPALGDVVEGALMWSHGPTFGQRWKGLWRMIRGARKTRR